ncbi:MAG: ISAs1 family transposase [Cyclobacteriaceae bacterium]|nr:ISAs1 family transposase [Cyclobacteriaceae bacterium]
MEDPRCNKRNTVYHPLTEMMFLVISAAVSGLNTWTDIQLFGEERLDWLRKFFPYKKGIPWHGTLGRVFARLDNEQFAAYFIEWIGSLSELTKGEVVAIDGKRIRGSYDKSDGKDAIHMVSAYASEHCLCLGQVATEQKSNEITAIPKLLELINLENSTVTIDAMGCQKVISRKNI